jgi:hypothetical protein
MGRNTMTQDTGVHWVGQQEISLTTTQPRGCSLCYYLDCGSAAALLDKLLYPLQHNAEGHKRCWILNIFCHLKLN